MTADALVTLSDIQEASRRIRSLVPPTPIKDSIYLGRDRHQRVVLKLENLNVSGSFKIRGAANALQKLEPAVAKEGIVAASAGNHAQGVAYSCQSLGAPATIFMPERTPLVKVQATKAMGARVVLTGSVFDDAYDAAKQYLKEQGGTFVHPFGDPAVIAGQGTIGLELLDQVPDLSAVVISIGGGGCISGIACAIKEINPKVKVFGVQTEYFPAMRQSLDRGELTRAAVGKSTIADGIACKAPYPINFAMAQKYVDDVVLVTEDEIAAAIMDLMEKDHLLVEGAGAAAAAAIQENKLDLPPPEAGPVVCLVSGGNIDVNLVNKIIPKGMLYSGRLMRLVVKINDKPGSLAELLDTLGDSGANLLEVQHNRLFSAGYADVEVEIDLETIDKEHQARVAKALDKDNWQYRVHN